MTTKKPLVRHNENRCKSYCAGRRGMRCTKIAGHKGDHTALLPSTPDTEYAVYLDALRGVLSTAGALQARGGKNTLGDYSNGAAAVAPRQQKQLSKREQRTPKGRFATHIAALMAERGWDHVALAQRMDVGEATVRKWLRAESVPETLDLERLGKALDTTEYPLPDYRMVLPPPK